MVIANRHTSASPSIQLDAQRCPDTLLAVVHRLTQVTDGVISIELLPANPNVQFPAFTAGAHIDLYLPNGLVRSYSLHNAQEDIGRYAVGVFREVSSRGGSSWLHGNLRVGDVLSISKPRNNFALAEQAPRSVFVSGGIGVTPLLSMIRRLKTVGSEAHLLYCARNRNSAPFFRDLEELASEKLTIQSHFSEEAGSVANIRDYLSVFSPDDHFYCCGPSSMLDAFEAACDSLGFANVHVERFKSVAQSGQTAAGGQCIVELARSGRILTIRKDKALLGYLRAAGADVESSCEEGVCGACETSIVSGEAEHRDSILSKAQKASNKVLMVCVSRCKSDRLVLDL